MSLQSTGITECNGTVFLHVHKMGCEWNLQDDHRITSLLIGEVGDLQFQNFLNEENR